MITVTPWDELAGINAPMLVLTPGVTLIDENRQYEFWAELALVFRWDVRD